jgi:hypothetical protein
MPIVEVLLNPSPYIASMFTTPDVSDPAKACLAAAKTIINETKQELPDESPILWTTQAFSVAAAVSSPID